MDTRPHSSALRRGRHSELGRMYLVTTVTKERKPVFREFKAARIVVKSLAHAQAMEQAMTLAYVLMPDHLHWLLQLTGDQALSRVVRSVKSVSAHRLGGALWQRGFHDHALRRDEDIEGIARYIVANPLRAGLVRHIGDYPHWDAIWI